MDLTNDLTNDLFQKFPLKSKKIDNDHFVLLKATIFLTLPGLPMPSVYVQSFIHKSLLLCLQRVALRKEGCQLTVWNTSKYYNSPTRHWTTHIHPCGSMSLVSLVTLSWSILMTLGHLITCLGGKRFFKPNRISTIQSKRKKEKAKKHVQLTRKFWWKSCSATHLHFLPSNSTILNALTSKIKKLQIKLKK